MDKTDAQGGFALGLINENDMDINYMRYWNWFMVIGKNNPNKRNKIIWE